ncbi:Rid family hydrolase [Plantactinospora endophytica]|uniref:RidA family protein n=1 Tax=Plantactinospora endophytica TaxID=673535 RepID=A0ABQ4EF42_9ACTN|nr:Rid family hydrolase [Plantactinospora endophytica]GIG93289.1 hypothetical protein Pen02_82250 [Plantactinospora endophytica]
MTSTEILTPEHSTTRTFREHYRYAMARRIGQMIVLSGQTGHNPDMTISSDVREQANVAFDNIGDVLAAAEVTWDNVDVIRSYHVVPAGADTIPEDSFNVVHDLLAARMPNHLPVWSAIGVAGLGATGMLIEIEAVAHS